MNSRRKATEEPLKLHHDAVVVDAHHDIPLDIWLRRGRGEIGALASWGQELRRGGVDVQVFPTYVPSQYLPEMALRVTLGQIAALYAETEADSSALHWVETYDDIEVALADGKIAGIISLEGCEAFGRDVELLRIFYRLGVRMVSFTWNRRTAFADGLAERETGGGLTQLGVKALQEVNRLGMVMDVSHISEAGFWDVIKTAMHPLVASHANCRAVCDSPRNLSDKQIRALANTGGVIGIMLVGRFVDPDKPTVARLVDHIVHAVDLVGIEHVGLGSDLIEDGLKVIADAQSAAERLASVGAEIRCDLEGCRHIHELPILTEEMVQRGFSAQEVQAVLGGNFLRVFRQVLR